MVDKKFEELGYHKYLETETVVVYEMFPSSENTPILELLNKVIYISDTHVYKVDSTGNIPLSPREIEAIALKVEAKGWVR